MTENEALEALADELINGEVATEPQEPQGEPQGKQSEANEPQGETNEPQNKPKEPSNAELMAELQALKARGEAGSVATQGEQNIPQTPAVNLANLEAMRELGLGELGEQLQENLNFIEQQKAQLAEQQEQARLTAVFESNISKFKEKYPTIKIDELKDFIESNNLKEVLSENFVSWDLIGKAMINIAKTNNTPDDITSSSGGSGSKKSAFDRLKNGDEVSDLEIGAELLNL
ncbi:MAG: HIT family hydrolase [Campylobacter sp.]|nr:HIT family hydrolase [Campylobacter sp.]